MPKKRDLMAVFGKRLDIPREMLPGGFSLELCGTGELTVRGCKRILSYAEQQILLQLPSHTLLVEGEGLLCSAFCAGAVTVSGEIRALTIGEGMR